MRTFVIKRLLLMIPTLFGISFVVWGILASAPQAPPTAGGAGMEEGQGTGEGGGVERSVKIFRAQYGLDKPAVLNTYYGLEAAEVRAEVEKRIDKKLDLAVRNKAQEKLLDWGYYAVPGLIETLGESDGALQDATMRWLVRSAERIAVGADTGKVDEKTVRKNRVIIEEGEWLKSLAWTKDASPARIAAGVKALQNWYHGVRGAYAADLDAAAVATALDKGDAAAFAGWGRRAVPALVGLVLDDEGRRDKAVAQLARSARVEGDTLANDVLDRLPWGPDDPPARKLAGVDLVRIWWDGAHHNWDYSGLRWARVLFLETQFAKYWGNLLRFDLGNSTVHKVPVFQLILERLKYSLTLAVSSLILAYLVSVPLGIVSARFHNTVGERIASLVVFALYSLPSFFVATLVVRYMAIGQPGSLEWIPDGGFEDVRSWRLTSWEQIKDIAWHVVAPIACMTYASFAALSRFAKTGLLAVIRSDYVRTARAKGVSEFWVLMKHAARNGIIPVVTLLGTTLPVIVGGSFIIEFIFSIPGFGLLTLQSIFARDYNVIIGITLIVGILTMIGILLSDLLYAIVDPRISH